MGHQTQEESTGRAGLASPVNNPSLATPGSIEPYNITIHREVSRVSVREKFKGSIGLWLLFRCGPSD